ncbi:MAG: hypothetical protein NT087_06670 [Deltaproteobacteria bacterium]|nr:hypothetical protein [Deltaproteobacteria bacterium]
MNGNSVNSQFHPLQAIPVNYTPLISRYDGDGVTSDAEWSGVAHIHDGLISGSGVLLSSGLHLLTVAHLVDDLALVNSTVVFGTPSGSVSRRIQAVEDYPGVWNDLALVTLGQGVGSDFGR